MSQPDSPVSGGVLDLQKPRSNIYTALLILALLAILVGILFLWLEIQEYDGEITPKSVGAAPADVVPTWPSITRQA